MSDNLTRNCAIRNALKLLRPTRPTGNLLRHLLTTAHLVGGIVGSKHCRLPAIASKTPDGRKLQSRVMRFRRWLKNEQIDAATYYQPYLEMLLANLPEGPLVLVMDASLVGRGCIALLVSVLYQKRALPLCWSVVKGKKGHLPETAHVTLLEEAAKIVGQERTVIFLGDGEFDGVDLLGSLAKLGWHFVCRTSKNTVFFEGDERFCLADFPLQTGDRYELEDIFFTERGFGPVLLVAVWRAGEKEPLCLVSNLEFFDEVLFWYKRRFQIETFFSDQKSRGFRLAHSHLSDPFRLERLMIATCLAYLWVVCLGALVKVRGWLGQIHRTDRCDLSLFQIGLLWIEHCLNEGLPLLVPFKVPRGPDGKSVR